MRTEIDYWWKQDITPIPLIWRTKQPRVKWKCWVGKRPPEELVNSWFVGPRSNTGIILDKGLTVLDFDKIAAYFRWRTQNVTLAKTYTVKTARGYHAYYRMDTPIEKTLKFTEGDIKATGIVVTPPSIHPTGVNYLNLIDTQIMRLTCVDELCVELVSMPEPPPHVQRQDQEGDGVIAKIKDEIGIVEYLERYTRLEWKDEHSMMGVCPFHEDHSPSLAVYPGEDVCYCYSPSCIAHRRSDVINAVSYLYNVDTFSAVRILANELL